MAAAPVLTYSRSPKIAWLATLFIAGTFLIGVNWARVQRIQHVSGLGGGMAAAQTEAPPKSRDPLERLTRNGLIAQELGAESQHWIMQTQQMFRNGEWRVRHIDYENAPFGRTLHGASPYRWWLGFVAWSDHVLSDRPIDRSVEHAALYADPLLHALLLLGTACFVAWRFGALPAGLVSVGLVGLFPLAGEFLPGAPDDRGLTQVLAIWSVLLLVAGCRAKDGALPATRRWFFAAGWVGGLGLWVSVAGQIPVLVGIGVGAMLAAWFSRGVEPLPWRSWATGGSIATLCAYLAEFAPAHLGEWQLTLIHPLYGLAWLGAGEVLAQAVDFIQGRGFPRSLRNLARLALAVFAMAATPVVIWKVQDRAALVAGVLSDQLTRLPDGATAQNLAVWLIRDGWMPSVWITLLPLLLVGLVAWSLRRRPQGGAWHVVIALALGPVLVALGIACRQLSWWNTFDALLLVMLAAWLGESQGGPAKSRTRLLCATVVLAVLSVGVWRMVPSPRAKTEDNLGSSEVLGLIQRDLAAWLAQHADPAGAVVLAPPGDSTALCYYGGVRGIGALSWENREGVAAAVRVLSAPSFQEAKELIDRRGITHIVVLSWDAYFDQFARAGTGQVEGSLLGELHTWKLPSWLRPVAYQLPTIDGFEGQSATVFEVVESQDEASLLARTAEYFLETGDLEKAAATAQALRRYPADFGAWVVRAEVELAQGDEAAFAKSLKLLQSRLNAKSAPPLPWDLRVGLAVLLAKAKLPKLSLEQVRLCLATADTGKLRALSSGSLYRLLVLSRVHGLSLEPDLLKLAVDLVPGELRDRLK